MHFQWEENPFPAIGDAANRKHVGGGPSYGHKEHAQKIGKDRTCDSGDILADRQTDPQTDILITILRTAPAGEVKAKFHYASWFGAASKLVADQFRTR